MTRKIKNQVPPRKNPGNDFRGGRTRLIFLGFAFLFTVGGSAKTLDLQFKMELSKTEIYVGEQTFCNFVIYTNEEVIDVEVEKFPDFRGYWKDNLILRQGPIPTSISPGRGFRKAIIGSYLITPMLGDLPPIIDPMKIVIRDPVNNDDPSRLQTAVSEGKAPSIKPLPAVTDKQKAKFFGGAVGDVNLTVEKNISSFTKDEPFILRFGLAGQANFQDINDLKLMVPPKVEILSKRTSIQGSGQFFTKVFEYTLAVHRDENLLIDPLQFLVFSPTTKKYTLLETAPIHLQREAMAPLDSDDVASTLPLLPLEVLPTEYRPWHRNPWFFAVQSILVLIFGSLVAWKSFSSRFAERANNPAKNRKIRSKQAILDLKSGKVEAFLKAADQLAYETLREKVPDLRMAGTRTELLRAAKTKLSPEVWSSAQTLFKAYDDFLFKPTKQLIEDEASLNRSLETVLKD